jgi:hypothetical protein
MYLFGRVFTKENLNEWISELNQLSYPEDSDESRRMQVWRGIFLALQKRVESKQ